MIDAFAGALDLAAAKAAPVRRRPALPELYIYGNLNQRRTRIIQNPIADFGYTILLHSRDVCRNICEAGLLGSARMRV
ncbi:MAG: hypothetical protein ACREDD_05120 [Methylocella sp.]